ncbi:hypothetical protein RHGRI_031638 [Rhododendron griersonianum]|uniref:Kri1-like C-terminal domain-containing protein n=1 Tax=Rhododendron griersonianum TaxID=479676 RepID=A0AAV6IC17_9ERIC|nr:hypothetical protein RHGRI_031638 [Rhododendron griersonianum]
MGMKLFEGSDVSDEEDISRIEINKEFARRYEHNKKREDLQKLDELKKNGVVSDSSDSDGSDSEEAEKDELTNSKRDLEFLNALIKVKNHDPELRDKEAKLFDSEDESGGEEVEKRDKKKPIYLKDVAAMHLIEEGAEFDDDDDEEEEEKRVKSYKEEQEELRREFLDAAEAALDEDDGGELLKERARNGMGDNNDDDDDTGEVEKKLNEFFGEDDNLDENEKFLKKYFRNRMWVGDEGNSEGVKGLNRNEDLGLSEDEEEVGKQEDYERGYNFRHEENAGDRVLGHSRVVEGSVRKKTNARKAQRKSKEERMAQAEFERKEELKHLKNLKKKEMKEKLRKIMDTAGIGEDRVCPLDVDDLEEEFDPEEYDRKMKEAFDDEYYGAEDVDPEFGSDGDEDELEKPDFDKEDDLLGLPKGWDDASASGSGSGDGFLAFRERKLKRRAENGVPNEQMEEEAVNEEGKGKKKRKMSEMEKEVIKKELEEYYKLDYEDTIEDLKTRFKYREVGAKKFGLSTEEILRLDDKELNQYVSLKKIAPYREKEWKVLRNKRPHLHGISNGQKTDKKLRVEHKKPKENEEAHVEKSNGDKSNLSRKSRRKLRQAEFTLPPHRIWAYGKNPSKSKSKKKH